MSMILKESNANLKNICSDKVHRECDVLFVEYTLESISNYTLKINSALKEENFNIKTAVLHFDSIQKTKKDQKVKGFRDIRCFDVCSFHTFNLFSIVKKLSPKVVVMFNHSFLMDRALIRVCRRCNVTTVFFQHGIQSSELQRKSLTITILIDKIRRYAKYALYYLSANRSAFFGFNMWLFVLKAPFFNVSQIPDIPMDDTHCDYAYVWGPWYRDLFIKLNGYSQDKITIIGCPGLDDMFFNKDKEEKSLQLTNVKDEENMHKGTVLYITQPFVSARLVTSREYRNFLERLIKIARKLDVIIYLGIHPRDRELYKYVKEGEGVKLIRNAARFIQRADIVIGHSSSLLGVAAVYGKPVLIMDVFQELSIPAIPGFTDISTWICKSLVEIEEVIRRVINKQLFKEELDSIRESLYVAQQYFAINKNGVYKSFAKIILKEFLKENVK